MPGNHLKKYFLFLGLLFILSGFTSGQKKGDISLGFGFPELSNIGFRYPIFSQFRTGISVGWLPRTTFDFGGWNNLITMSGDLYYHFGRISYFPDMRIFYVNAGVNFIQEKPYDWDQNWWNAYLRVGGEVYSSYHFGVNIDGGIIYNLNPEKNWAMMERFMPAMGIDVFWRF